eukprot:2363362-Pyramimonas_sp.AAC.1
MMKHSSMVEAKRRLPPQSTNASEGHALRAKKLLDPFNLTAIPTDSTCVISSGYIGASELTIVLLLAGREGYVEDEEVFQGHRKG